MEENYKNLVKFIADSSGTPEEEVLRRIEAKRAKLSGLISQEGAAQVIAAELGVNFDKQIIKIGHIVPGMKKINLVGKVITLFPIREYNKNGRQGRIGSFVLADETSNIRVVLWDESHIDLIAKGQIFQEGIIEISNASLRNGELHLASFSDIKPSHKSIEQVMITKPTTSKKIKDFITNDNASTRAFILNIFEPRFFEVCPECRKKAENNQCMEHGKIIPERKVLLNLILDDGSDSIRSVMFSDSVEKLVSKDILENLELFSVKKQEILGKELIVSGQVRQNKMFNNNELIVSDIKEVDLGSLIEELER